MATHGIDSVGRVEGLRELGFRNAGEYLDEIFARNLGPNTPIKLSRGQNAQWTKGGLQYSPPFR